MKSLSKVMLQRSVLLLVCFMFAGNTFAKKEDVFTVKQGDLMILMEGGKSATFEIDYSEAIVPAVKKKEVDLPFYEWMEEMDAKHKKGKWVKDWVEKDSAECSVKFREEFNESFGKGVRLSSKGKDYRVIVRIKNIYLGDLASPGKALLLGMRGGAIQCGFASGELEIRDQETGEVKLLVEFNGQVGEESYTQIGRLKGIYINLTNDLERLAKKYKKQLKK